MHDSIFGDGSACCNERLAGHLATKNPLSILSRALAAEDVDLNGLEVEKVN
jgi:hypothetical protein